MKTRLISIFTVLAAILFGNFDVHGCTSALIGAKASRSGRPMLWKHRDTSTTDNVVEYVPSENGSYSYVALFNAADRKLEQAWMGMNDVGFAVMNTASYNIKDDKVSAKKMDREGYVMTIALKTCRTVDDFARLLETLPRPMGVEANFGVIDAEGNGAFFETNNHSYVRYNVDEAEGNVIIRTNYSHSGRANEGYGYVREKNAEYLLADVIKNSAVTPEFLTEYVSRNFYHAEHNHDFGEIDGERWVYDEDFIPRYKSTATVVIEGCLPVSDSRDIASGQLADQYIMWTGLGYPPCAEIVPVWCKDGGVDSRLRGLGQKGHSVLGDEAKKRRAEVFPVRKGYGNKYIDMRRLFNDEGTGYVQTLVPKNMETYKLTKAKRDSVGSQD